MNGDSDGTLQKMLIESFSDEKYKDYVGESHVLFNPNKYALKYEIEYNEEQPSGTASSAPSFSNMKSQELTLEFMIDGTGVASDETVDVQEKVDTFLSLCYDYDGDIHSNRYLRVSWSYLVFDCVLKSADVNYTLFHASGKPLRAKIGAKFLGFVNDELRELKMAASSPDRTHVRKVETRGRLDLMTHRIYRSPQYYIDVAKVNDLTNLRKLKVGMDLVFPQIVREAARS